MRRGKIKATRYDTKNWHLCLIISLNQGLNAAKEISYSLFVNIFFCIKEVRVFERIIEHRNKHITAQKRREMKMDTNIRTNEGTNWLEY